MSLISGDLGSKSIFPDGLQSDHLSENSVGHGVRVRGISDPTTYPVLTGDVGEVVGPYTAVIASVNAAYTASGSLVSLPSGRWALWVTGYTSYAATNTAIVFGAAVNNNASSNAGMDNTGTGTGSLNTQYSGNTGTGAYGVAGPYFVDLASSTPIYVKAYNSGTNINVSVILKAQRIA